MDLFDKIEQLFGFDIKTFFISYIKFVNFDLPRLTSFYNNGTEKFPESVQNNLSSLKNTYLEIMDKFEVNRDYFVSTDYFSLLDEIEDIGLKLETYSNLPKWLGVSGNYGKRDTLTYTLSKNEGLESAMSKVGYSDRDQSSIDVAFRNSIKETDYGLDGGFSFQINFQTEGSKVSLASVIDLPMEGNNLLGKDFSRVLEFSEEESDFKILTPAETFNQACFICMRLKVGDNPESPFKGIDKTLLINRATVATAFPIVLRQFSEVVGDDDTIKKMDLLDIGYEQDSIKMKCSFYSYLSNLEKVIL